jgi:hypothetical protein
MATYRAFAACVGFGFARNTAPAFYVIDWLQIPNSQVTNFGLVNSAPNRADYIDIWRSVLHCRHFVATLSSGCLTDTLLAGAKHCDAGKD